MLLSITTMSNLRKRNVFFHISKIHSERLCSIRELKMIEACEFQPMAPEVVLNLVTQSANKEERERESFYDQN
mgnify:CR=1 FL=1